MVVIIFVVLVVLIVGLFFGVVLMYFIYWKVLFGIIVVMGLVVWFGLLLIMLEMVCCGDVLFSFVGVLCDFCNVFCNCIFLFGVVMLLLSYILLMNWVVVLLVILMDVGGLIISEFVWSQVLVFSVVIIVNLLVVCWVKDFICLCFVFSVVLVQMFGLVILIVGNLVWFYVWLWLVFGICFYVFGIGLIFLMLFCFIFFFNDLLKGMVFVLLNIVIFSVSVLLIEGVCWLWFYGGRFFFYLLVVVVGIVVVCCLVGLLCYQCG